MAINTINATDLGSSGSGFIPAIWAGRALEVLRSATPLVGTIARDSDFSTAFSVGDTLNINYPGTFTASTKSSDTVAALQKPVGGKKVPVVLNTHAFVDIEVEDVLQAQSQLDQLDIYVRPAAIALANKVETDIYGLLSGLANRVGAPGTDLSASAIRNAGRSLDMLNVPQEDRQFAVSPKDKAAILGDSTLATYFAFAQQQALSEGNFGKLYNFDFSMSQLLATSANSSANDVQTVTIGGAPTGGNFTLTFGGQTTAPIGFNPTAAQVATAFGALSNVGAGNIAVTGVTGGPFTITFIGAMAGALQGAITATTALTGGSSPTVTIAHTTSGNASCVAYHRNAFIIAFRALPTPLPGSGASCMTMMDPESGLGIRVLHQYDMANRANRIGFDFLYGVASLRSDHGVLVST